MTESYTTADALEAAALQRCAELRADGQNHAPPVPAAVAKRPPEQKSAAEWAYQRLILYLKAFEENLAAEEEAAMGFTAGPGGLLRIMGIGFHAPDIVTFTGVDEAGLRTQSIQHVSQLNVVLRAIPKPSDQPEPTRIGFRLARALEEAEGEAQHAAPEGG